jgi:hypothetical protein
VLPRAAGGPDPIPSRLSLLGADADADADGDTGSSIRPPLRALLRANATRAAAAAEHPPGPPSRLARRLGLAWDAAAAPVYQVALLYDDSQQQQRGGTYHQAAAAAAATTPLDLEFRVVAVASSSGAGASLSASATFRTDLFTERSASRLLRHWAHLLGAAALPGGLDGPADRLPLMNAAESEETLRLSRGRLVDWDVDATVGGCVQVKSSGEPLA